jgi:hypothetical protein
MQPRYLLFLAFALFAASLLLPTLAVDLGVNGGSILPGYRVLLAGPFAAYAIILEPGGIQLNIFLGAYYLLAWLANFALVLPFLTVVSHQKRLLLGAIAVCMVWSVLFVYLFIAESLIREIAVGYYLWAASITAVFFFLRANKGLLAPENIPAE